MAFKRWKKSRSKRPPTKLWTPEELKVIGWCMSKKIYIENCEYEILRSSGFGSR